MTDPEFADATYVEPITAGVRREGHREGAPRRAARHAGRADGAEHRDGARQGRRPGEVRRGADRRLHRGDRPRREPRVVQEDRRGARRRGARSSAICHTLERLLRGRREELGYPMVVRPSFTMGGTGSGMAYDEDDLRRIAGAGLAASPTTEVLLEESIIGWKEYELEVMRDTARQRGDRLLDREPRPDGRAHRRLDHGRAGDDADRPRVPAPARPLDRHHPLGRRRHRRLQHPVRGQPRRRPRGRDRDEPAGLALQRAGVARRPASRSPRSRPRWRSATPSTRSPTTSPSETPASFEPTLDYVVVKVPRFAFEKFPAADPTLTTHMKSVGEAMAIGRNFTEALQKALRSLEDKKAVFDWSHEPGRARPGRPARADPHAARRPAARR